MNRHQEQIWYQFEQDILAVNESSALTLLAFLRKMEGDNGCYQSMEVYDLQRYKVIKKPKQVRNMLHLSPQDRIFIFPVCIN